MRVLRARRLQVVSVAVALAAIALSLWMLHVSGDRGGFFRAYLFSYLFCLGIALGSLCLLMLHNLTGGAWGDAIRLVARAASLSLPVLAVLFVPVVLGMAELYPWAGVANAGMEDSSRVLIEHRRAYLNGTFFVVRAGIYFIVWTVLALLLHRWQGRFQRSPTGAGAARIRGLSAAGLILYLLTMTHAGIDWIMSRNSDFYSTAFGFILTVGQTLSAVAFAIVVAGPEPDRGALTPAIGKVRAVLNDVGNILLTLVILWAYVSFMEFLIIWMGNSGEDNAWFLNRGFAGDAGMNFWRVLAIGILVLHFFVPFYLLLFRNVKQKRPALVMIAWIVLVAHVFEQYWLAAAPNTAESRGQTVTCFDPLMLIAVFGLWFAAFLWLLRRARPEASLEGVQEGKVAHG